MMPFDERGVIGKGVERVVYPDPIHPDRVKKVELPEWKGLESVEYVKARFYLTKILSFLLPGAIPILTASWLGKENVVVAKRVIPDEKHRSIDALLRKKRRTREEEDELERLTQERLRWLQENPGCRALIQRLDDLGLKYDANPQNFLYNEQEKNQIVYVDSFSPWISDSQDLHRGYDIVPLLEGISHLQSPHREVATRYLHRLEELFLKESTSYKLAA